MVIKETEAIPQREPKFLGFLDSENKIKIVREEHYLWKMHERLQKSRMPYSLPCMMGRWHYHYTNDKKQHISLICTDRGRAGGRKVKNKLADIPVGSWKIDGIEMPNVPILRDIPWQSRFWEICSGGTCPGCSDADELFYTRKEAEVRIRELLK